MKKGRSKKPHKIVINNNLRKEFFGTKDNLNPYSNQIISGMLNVAYSVAVNQKREMSFPGNESTSNKLATVQTILMWNLDVNTCVYLNECKEQTMNKNNILKHRESLRFKYRRTTCFSVHFFSRVFNWSHNICLISTGNQPTKQTNAQHPLTRFSSSWVTIANWYLKFFFLVLL